MATFYLDPTAGSNGDGSIGSPFNSLENCLAAILPPFNSATEDYIVNCLAGADPSSDDALIAVNTSSSTARILQFVANGANRHTGVRGTGYRFTNQIRVNNDNTNVVVELTGLACRSIQQDRSVAVTAVARDCLVVDSAGPGVLCGGGTIRLINTAVIGSTHANVVAENNNGSAIIEAINCTSVNAGADGGFVARFGGQITAVNCYSGGNTGADYSGVTSPTNCYSEDGSQSTSTAAYNTSNFINVTAGSENLKLPSGSALIGAGVGPASNGNVPTTDFEGDTRSGTTTDVGFDQRAAGGVSGALSVTDTGPDVLAASGSVGNNGLRLTLRDTDTGALAANLTGLIVSVRASSDAGSTMYSSTSGTTSADGVYELASGAIGNLGDYVYATIEKSDNSVIGTYRVQVIDLNA